MLSFHTTKLYHTIEGGCLIYNNVELKKKIYLLCNFGIENEDKVAAIGINGKMNEIQAAIGLLTLQMVEEEKQIAEGRFPARVFDPTNRLPAMPELMQHEGQPWRI